MSWCSRQIQFGLEYTRAKTIVKAAESWDWAVSLVRRMCEMLQNTVTVPKYSHLYVLGRNDACVVRIECHLGLSEITGTADESQSFLRLTNRLHYACRWAANYTLCEWHLAVVWKFRFLQLKISFQNELSARSEPKGLEIFTCKWSLSFFNHGCAFKMDLIMHFGMIKRS